MIVQKTLRDKIKSALIDLCAPLAGLSARQQGRRYQMARNLVLFSGAASVGFAVNANLYGQLLNTGAFLTVISGVLLYTWMSDKRNAGSDQGTAKSQSGDPKYMDFDVATLVASASGLTCLVVDRTGYVSQTSANLYDVLGLDKSDVTGPDLFNRVHLGDKVAFLSALDQVACGIRTLQCKVRLQLASKHEKSTNWSDVTCTIVGAGEKLLLMIGGPGSQQKHHSTRDQNFKSDRLGPSALAVVSHELRTPLNAIIGFSDLLSKGMAGPMANPRQSEYISLIHQSGMHLLELVNSILDLSKLENGTFDLEQEDFSPEEAAQFAISLLAQEAYKKNIALDYLPLSGMDTFSGDRRICRQIILNLLSNAVKFTPENGQIHLKVETLDHRLLITVTDNGIGMSDDQLAMVGTPYFQASGHLTRMHNGAGLGLSLVRQMAKLHGGSIEIQSTCAKGPIAQGGSTQPTREQGSGQQGLKQQGSDQQGLHQQGLHQQGLEQRGLEQQGTSVRVALASLAANRVLVTQLRQNTVDESSRIIQIVEEHEHVSLRKTA